MGNIVVFDSGLGGISVLRELRRLLPREDFLYFGDSALAPYGTRSTEEVRNLTLQRIADLSDDQTKAVVIACNTATSAAIEALREKYPDRIVIGIEPALKLAAERFPGGKILVMATNVTLREEKFARLMQRFADTHEIIKVPCPGLVELIEAGQLQGEQIQSLLMQHLGGHLEKKPDAVVLGCTHYPFAKKAIRQIMGDEVCILDGGEGTARETRRRLEAAGLLRKSGTGSVTLRNSLQNDQMLARAEYLLELEEI